MEQKKGQAKSSIWKYFIKRGKGIATCKVCFNDYSHRTTITNLKSHWTQKHADLIGNENIGYDSDNNDGKQEGESPLVSSPVRNISYNRKSSLATDETKNVWALFTRKERGVATCNTCHKDYSCRTTITNLRKHWREQHGTKTAANEISNSDTSDTSDEEEMSTDKSKGNPTWKYFVIPDSDKFTATCKICETEVDYDSVEDLANHVRDHGEKVVESDDEELQVILKKSRKIVSKAWQFFDVINSETKHAACKMCHKIFSYGTSVTNLKKHVRRKHPDVDWQSEDADETNKWIISSDGQLYEIATTPQKVEAADTGDDDERDPIEMDTVYLEEDLEDSIEQLQTTTAQEKIRTPKKTKFAVIPKKITKEQRFRSRNSTVRNSTIRNSTENEIPSKKPLPNKSLETIDYFGQYVTSLLKDMPKHVSDQLQSDIIKQIMMAKVNLAAQTSKNYAITINNGHINSSQTAKITEPVTVTVTEEQPEITATYNSVNNVGSYETIT